MRHESQISQIRNSKVKTLFGRDRKQFEDKFGSQCLELAEVAEEDDSKPPTLEKSKRFRYLVNTHMKIQKAFSSCEFDKEQQTPAKASIR